VAEAVAGGEPGMTAGTRGSRRLPDLREQCARSGVSFRFKQTGRRFLKDGKIYDLKKITTFAGKGEGINYSLQGGPWQ
jgi:protein gp37